MYRIYKPREVGNPINGEHYAILSTFSKLPFVIKIFVLSFMGDHFKQVLLYIHYALANLSHNLHPLCSGES